ncbi:MAG TPA: hypothetical protein PLF16_01810 [Candidatus Staskawiczbacteria bacterium]|nr:hypothetical protein [Candidatus Staskawiczbacteria bacterium]
MNNFANRIMAEHLAGIFLRRGLDVFVRNGTGPFTLAIFGDSAQQVCSGIVGGMAGIDRFWTSDDEFHKDPGNFVDAREYFGE